MTGPEHYAEAERLLAVADRHTSGVTYGPEWTLTLTAAHVHATLALAAATAVGTAGPDRHAWTDIAATKPSGSKPEPPSGSPPRPRTRAAAPSAALPARGQAAPLVIATATALPMRRPGTAGIWAACTAGTCENSRRASQP